jgi:peroxiredoxin
MRTLIFAVVSAAALFACDGASSGRGASTASGESGGLVGNPAPDFTVTSVHPSKGAVTLSHLKGKVVVVDFWGTFCEPCKRSFPKLQGLSAKYKGSGLEVVGISEDEPEDKDKIPSFANAHSARFPLALDEGKTVARRYNPPAMPTSFVIDRKGIVRFAHFGFKDGEEVALEQEIKQLLEER